MARHPSVAAAPAEPAPTFDTSPVRTAVRRLSPADIDRQGAWLIPAIQEIWGGPTVTVVNGWLRLWMNDNNYHPVITESGQSVGLALIDHDPMDPDVVVRQVFLRHAPGSEEDGIDVYLQFLKWAESVNAKEFRFDKAAAERREAIKKAIPTFKWRSNCYVDLRE